jgi:PHD/YefM family antitoxin component YafN of YafNO toxin-antitoxin module
MLCLLSKQKKNYPGVKNMKTVSSEQIRGDFTEIANKVRYNKESYILTRHNKPYVGIVPLELLDILSIIIKHSVHNKHIAKILQDNATFITNEDLKFLSELERRPTKTPPSLKNAAVSVKGKIKGL